MAASSGTEAPSGLPQLATAVAAVVGVVGSLAVTGVLAEAQRNHGIALLVSFSCVLAGAVLWLIAGLLPSKRKTIDAPRRHQRLRRLVRWGRNLAPGFRVLAQFLAVILFGVGLGFAIAALIATQEDSERPAVSATFRQKTALLSGLATAEGLPSDRRLAIRVQGMYERKRTTKVVEDGHRKTTKTFRLVADQRDLYFALVGPGSDGKVHHAFRVYVPAKYELVVVKAWSGDADKGCTLFKETTKLLRSVTKPSEEDGCMVLRLPARTPATGPPRHTRRSSVTRRTHRG